MNRFHSHFGFLAAGALLAFAARAEMQAEAQIHVREYTQVDGRLTLVADNARTTGERAVSSAAPSVDGYLFVGWTNSTDAAFANRDRFGRACDAVACVPYEETTLVACYVPATLDADRDGVADGHELYWYGSLARTAASDTDGDGYSLAQEIAAGTNPLLKDRPVSGGVVWSDGAERWYNPHGYQPLVVRSEPEGALFAATTNYLAPGSVYTSAVCSASTTAFAYWTANGTRVADGRGRAKDAATVTVGSSPVTLVAHCVTDETDRAKLYWYGSTSVALSSDTDGDGYTLEQEIAAGTNPLLKDRAVNGGVVWSDGAELVYRSSRTRRVTFRCDPAGTLFATTNAYVIVGSNVTTRAYETAGTSFAYWTKNGTRMADRRGRALDTVSFAMPDADVDLVAVCANDATNRAKLYWYGSTSVALSSDTDGDGYTLAQEIAAGTCPLLKDRAVSGGVVWQDGALVEADLQPYEQAVGAVVDGAFAPLFTSPTAGNGGASRTFAGGAQVWPVVADVNGDGLWDLIVASARATNVFVNVGSAGNPQFEEGGRGTAVPRTVDLDMNSTAKLAAFTLDAAPSGALSATTNGATLLVSDAEGRIWYYSSTATGSYALQNKVWGGSRAGFANGLRLAAVDWDDDGDLDCLCGTAEGKLMLLLDPEAGRPAGLAAEVGASDVVLSWRATGQSRLRGYNVYRSAADAAAYTNVAQVTLPTHRDAPAELRAYDYRVTALSRFYTAGNSTPTEVESAPTEPVRAEFGKVRFVWRPSAGFRGEVVDVDFAAENARGLSADFQLKIAYDAAVLTPIEVKRSGLTENLRFASTASRGSWIVTGTGGTVAAGTGTFLTFSFRVADAAALASTSVTVEDFELGSIGGGNLIPLVGAAAVRVAAGAATDASVVPAGSRGDLDGNGRLGWNDVELMLRWKDAGESAPASVVSAGDYNGDGRLDARDYQLMRRDFRDREKRGGAMAGWDAGHNYRDGKE